MALASPAPAQQIKSSLQFGVAAWWDGNPLRLPPGAHARGDSRITPAIRWSLERSVGRKSVFVRGEAGYDVYRRFDQLNALRLGLDGGVHVPVGARCRLDAEGSFDTRRTDPGDASGQDPDRSRTLALQATAACPRPAGLHPSLMVRRTASDNSDPLRAVLESRVTGATATLFYSRPSLGDVGLLLGGERIDRPHGPAAIFPDWDVYRVGMRFDRRTAPRLQASAMLGYVDARSRSGGRAGHDGLEWRGELRWLPRPDSAIVFSHMRTLRAESVLAADFTLATRAALDASMAVGGRTQLSVSASEEKRRFRGARPFLDDPAREADKTLRLGAKLSYQLDRNLLLDAEVTHLRRNARPDRYDFRSTAAGVRLRYSL